MTEDDRLRALPLADRLRIAAVDLAVTGAAKALVEAARLAAPELEKAQPVAALAQNRFPPPF